jgi:HNH endonuclease/AP2 domain
MQKYRFMTILAGELKHYLNYDPETGVFTWRITASNRAKAGNTAGCVKSLTYRHIMVGGKVYYAHRLAWLYIHGTLPECEIDHINMKHDDNRIINLRLATRTENQCNTRRASNNTSGFKGVSWDRRNEKWLAQIKINGRQIYLGLFANAELAHVAYSNASKHLHGDFANAG